MKTIKEFTKEEAFEYIQTNGKTNFYCNFYGWQTYYTLEPTFATPTGKNKDFPRIAKF